MTKVQLEALLQEMRETQQPIEEDLENRGTFEIQDVPLAQVEFLRELNELEEERLLEPEDISDWL